MKTLNLLLISTISFFTLTGSNIINPQNPVPLAKLEEYCNYNNSKFEVEMRNIGYDYQSQTSSDKTKIYWFNKKRENGRQDQVSRTASKESDIPTIGFSTTSANYHQEFMTSLDKKGYKKITEEPKNSMNEKKTTWNTYSNNTYSVLLFYFETSDVITTYVYSIRKLN